MDHDQQSVPPQKPKMTGAVVAIIVGIGILAGGSRFLTNAKLNHASAETPEVRELTRTLDELERRTINNLHSDPDAVDNYVAQHTENLKKFREQNPDDDSIEAFMADFALWADETAPDTSIVSDEVVIILNFSTIESKSDLFDRARRLRQLDGVLFEMIEWLEELPGEFETQLAETDYSSRMKKQAKRDFDAGFDLQSRLKIQELDRRMLRIAGQMIEILNRSWGRWTYNTETGMLLFVDKSSLTTMNELTESLKDLAEEQQAVQIRMLTDSQRRR
jgi:outer membrane murein-binding lipoprotein Lpp